MPIILHETVKIKQVGHLQEKTAVTSPAGLVELVYKKGC